MTVEHVVQKAFSVRMFTPSAESEIERWCGRLADVTVDDYLALVRLRRAVHEGTVASFRRKALRNVMEDLVLEEVEGRLAAASAPPGEGLDLGDVVAFALNRLPPLYATTEEGACFQKEEGRRTLGARVRAAVEEAFTLATDRPTASPGRRALGRSCGEEVLSRVIDRVERYAPAHEN